MRDGHLILVCGRPESAPTKTCGAQFAEMREIVVSSPKRIQHAIALASLVFSLLLVGCRSASSQFATEFVGNGAKSIWIDGEQSDVILASVFEEPTTQPDATTQPELAPSTKPAESTTRPVPATRKRPYTRPRAVQQSAFLAVVAASLGASEASDSRNGSEASENILGRAELRGSTQVFGPSGATNVGIMQGPVFLQSASRPGLQQGGPLTGALPFNIFTPTPNTIGQRCPELVTAGFFSDLASCQNHFQP